MTQPAETDTIWVTQEAYDRLKQELEHLKGDVWTDITTKLAAARDEGDLKENGGYHAAREEQGKMEARIADLQRLLKNAVVGEAPKDDGVVEPGMVVTVEMFDETEKFLLGSREIIGDDSDLDVYSEQSPMGAALLGSKPGDTVTYDAPNGRSVSVKVVEATPYRG